MKHIVSGWVGLAWAAVRAAQRGRGGWRRTRTCGVWDGRRTTRARRWRRRWTHGTPGCSSCGRGRGGPRPGRTTHTHTQGYTHKRREGQVLSVWWWWGGRGGAWLPAVHVAHSNGAGEGRESREGKNKQKTHIWIESDTGLCSNTLVVLG